MIAKYNGTCRLCGQSISKGETIAWNKRDGAAHIGCHGERHEYDEDESAGLEPGTLASDRRLASRGLTVVRFSSGETMTQNSNGRCIDAPCCGCCS